MGSTTSPSQSMMECLEKFDQLHLLDFWEELDQQQRGQLEDEIRSIDFEQLHQLASASDEETQWADLARKAQPPAAWKKNVPFKQFTNEQAIEVGEQALRAGEVGMILVAGGQGTRLGFDQPKGLYPLGPLSNRTLLQILCDLLHARGKRHGVEIPLFIMTSPATDRETVAYLSENEWLGLSKNQVKVFCQGQMPAVSMDTRRILLADKHRIAMSPDGHGGMLAAFEKHGCLQKAKDLGVKHLFYGQVDNPLMQLCDPLLIGRHLLSKSEMTTQVVRKQHPTQRVGNVVSVDGKLCIIEYSDLPDEIGEQRDENGELKLWAGSIAVHVFDISFLDRMAQSSKSLPFHRAIKKVPHVDREGNAIDPEEPNALKFEKFIFDLMPFAENALAVEVDAADGFAPVKNQASAETETAKTAQLAMLAQYRQWLEMADVKIDRGVDVEINPMFALDASEIKSKLPAGTHFTESVYLY
jgi:UDP-N-acetylglucosamine/UDP-N-acetylgalactosamine diphosphorylase